MCGRGCERRQNQPTDVMKDSVSYGMFSVFCFSVKITQDPSRKFARRKTYKTKVLLHNAALYVASTSYQLPWSTFSQVPKDSRWMRATCHRMAARRDTTCFDALSVICFKSHVYFLCRRARTYIFGYPVRDIQKQCNRGRANVKQLRPFCRFVCGLPPSASEEGSQPSQAGKKRS